MAIIGGAKYRRKVFENGISFEREPRLYRWLSRDEIEGAKAWRFPPVEGRNVTAEAPVYREF